MYYLNVHNVCIILLVILYCTRILWIQYCSNTLQYCTTVCMFGCEILLSEHFTVLQYYCNLYIMYCIVLFIWVCTSQYYSNTTVHVFYNNIIRILLLFEYFTVFLYNIVLQCHCILYSNTLQCYSNATVVRTVHAQVLNSSRSNKNTDIL